MSWNGVSIEHQPRRRDMDRMGYRLRSSLHPPLAAQQKKKQGICRLSRL